MPVLSTLRWLNATYSRFEDHYQVTLQSHRTLKVRSAYTGRGELSCERNPALHADIAKGSWEAWFSLDDAKPVDVEGYKAAGEHFLTVAIDSIFPCSGLLFDNMEGRIMAPACKLDIPSEPDVWIMVLEPSRRALTVTPESGSLSVSCEEATATASLQGGEHLGCHVTMSGQKLRNLHLMMERRAMELSHKEAVSGQLGIGSVMAQWIPCRRNFDDTIWIINSQIGKGDLALLLEHLGAERRKGLAAFLSRHLRSRYLNKPFLLGDGPALDYTLRLVMDRSMAFNLYDETHVWVI